jgi:hypothetical protein
MPAQRNVPERHTPHCARRVKPWREGAPPPDPSGIRLWRLQTRSIASITRVGRHPFPSSLWYRPKVVRSPTAGPESVREEAPSWGPTAWDLREAARAAAFAGIAMILAWLVTAATDEGGIAWTERAARVLPLAPACAAWGTWLGQARGWARGEGRVLAALGRGPFASSAASVLGGASVAWAAALAMALVSQVSVAGFFPTARSPEVFVSVGAGEFENPATGERIRADGTFASASTPAARPSAAPEVSPVPPLGRMAAALASGLAGLALPLLVARTARGSRLEKAGLVLGTAASTVFLFHAAAARLTGPVAAVLPSLALLAWSAVRVSGRTRARF